MSGWKRVQSLENVSCSDEFQCFRQLHWQPLIVTSSTLLLSLFQCWDHCGLVHHRALQRSLTSHLAATKQQQRQQSSKSVDESFCCSCVTIIVSKLSESVQAGPGVTGLGSAGGRRESNTPLLHGALCSRHGDADWFFKLHST